VVILIVNWNCIDAKLLKGRWVLMLNFAWDVFSRTGNLETYLLIKELEQERVEGPLEWSGDLADVDSPIT
jgi:YqzL-like protein